MSPPDENLKTNWLTPFRFAALLALLVFASYPQIFLGLQTFVYRDFGYFSYPLAFHLRESFLRGEIPLWNPLNDCGLPFLAQWNTMVLYPPSWLCVAFPLSWWLGVFCLLHQFLGGLGMFFLARRWTDNPLAAAFAGIAFAFGGLTLNSIMWPATIAALGWMPWVVWLVERAWREGKRTLVWAALAGAMQMLTGGVEVILLTWVVVGIVALPDYLSGRRNIASRGVIVILLITGLCAAQLLPFMDFLQHSQRQQEFGAAQWPMPLTGWANFLVPIFQSERSYHGVFLQHNQYWTSSYYVGATTFALAIAAMWWARNWRVRALGGLTLFCLVLALGDATPVYRWLSAHVAALGMMRFPVKFVIVPVFALPLLAAVALATPRTPREGRRWLLVGFVTTVCTLVILWCAYAVPQPTSNVRATLLNGALRIIFLCVILAALWFIGRLTDAKRRGLLQLALLLLVWLDLFCHAPQPFTVNRPVYDAVLPRDFPPPKFGEARALLSRDARERLAHSFLPETDADFVSRRLAFFCDCNLLEAAAKVDGFFPLQLREHQLVNNLIYAADAPVPPAAPLLDFLGVSEMTAPTNIFDTKLRTNFLPLITGGQKSVFANEYFTLVTMLSTNFNPRGEVFLPLAATNSVTFSNATTVKISDTHFAAQRITAHVVAAAPAMVVVAQTFYHPWHAYVDGQRVELFRANEGFQAVQVPAGGHDLALAYEDENFALGWKISIGTLLICGMTWLGFSRNKSSPL